MSGVVVAKLKNIISEVTGCSIEDIGNDVDLQDAIGLDSFTAVEVLVAVEKAFGVKIAPEAAIKVRTLEDIILLLDTKVKKNG